MLSRNFFETSTDIYKRVLVKLYEASRNDTIIFKYKDRNYDVYISEILPIGLDWYAVAFVAESSRTTSTIIIE